jgi:hypothetical protein
MVWDLFGADLIEVVSWAMFDAWLGRRSRAASAPLPAGSAPRPPAAHPEMSLPYL